MKTRLFADQHSLQRKHHCLATRTGGRLSLRGRGLPWHLCCLHFAHPLPPLTCPPQLSTTHHPSTHTRNTTGKDKKRQTMPSQLCSLGHSAARDLGTPRSSSSTMCFVLQLVIIRKVVVVRCVGVGVLQQYYPTSPRRGRQVLDAASGLGRKVCCEEQTHDGTHEGVQTVKKLVLIFSVSSAPQRGRCWIQMKNCHHFLSSIQSTQEGRGGLSKTISIRQRRCGTVRHGSVRASLPSSRLLPCRTFC